MKLLTAELSSSAVSGNQFNGFIYPAGLLNLGG